jgi:hypothetical protein
MEAVQTEQLKILGDPKVFTQEELSRLMFKSLGVAAKVKREVNKMYLKEHIKTVEKQYHPMWVAKLLVIAERKPFPPKKIPRMCFIDGVSGYRGLLTAVPPISEADVPADRHAVTSPIITEEEVARYIKDVQEKQINRSYVLKKPLHEVVDVSLVHLPLWKVSVGGSLLKKEFILNANTGESEAYLANQWRSKKWII